MHTPATTPRRATKLRGIEFGPVWGASGVQGFFGEGYPYHDLLRLFVWNFSFEKVTFVAKTTTLYPRAGNMPLNDDLSPRHLIPRCISVRLRAGAALNAVGLSGPGAIALFEHKRWQKRTEPFFLSFMSVAKTPDERFGEFRSFLDLLTRYDSGFKARIGLQINLSCPNVGLNPGHLVEEAVAMLDRAGRRFPQMPLVPKLNALVPPDVAARIAEHPHCDALCVSNTLPWGSLPERIDWKGIFGSDESPLAEFGGGGLSGAPLFPIVCEWLGKAREIIRKPLNIGGGILSPEDVRTVAHLGASSVSLGSITMLHPWNLAKTVRTAHEVLSVSP